MGLGGGAIRFKVWAYLMLAKIYGEAALLEDPVTHYQDINKFTIMDFDAIIDKCIDWMVNGDKGYVGVNTIRWSQDDYLLLPHATDGNGTHLE